MKTVCFVIAIALGLMGQAAWMLGDLRWAAWVPDRFPTMKLSTSAMIILAATAGMVAKRAPHLRWACGLATLMVVAMVVGGYTSGGNLHLDDTDVMTIVGGMPSWGTLASFLIVGVDRLVDHPPQRWVACSLLVIAGVALLGYAIGVPWMFYYSPELSTGMALPTALAIALLGAGMWLEGQE